MSNRRAGKDPVQSITSTAAPLGDDIARRSRRYLAQMTLRTLCFLGAVFTWGHVPTPVSVSMLVGAVVLPYVAVVLANAGRERPEQADPYTQALLQLGASPAAAPTGTRSPADDRYGRSAFDHVVHDGMPFDPAAFDDGQHGGTSTSTTGPRSAGDHHTGHDGVPRNGHDRG